MSKNDITFTDQNLNQVLQCLGVNDLDTLDQQDSDALLTDLLDGSGDNIQYTDQTLAQVLDALGVDGLSSLDDEQSQQALEGIFGEGNVHQADEGGWYVVEQNPDYSALVADNMVDVLSAADGVLPANDSQASYQRPDILLAVS